MGRWVGRAGAVLAVAAGLAQAAENAAEVTLVYPCRPAAGPIRIDGQIEPAEWAGAVEVSGFTISGTEELAPQQMVMWLLYDRTHLYVAVKCLESRMAHLVTSTHERDGPFWLDDSIEFFIDGDHDHDTFWQFAVTAANATYDSLEKDPTWNCDWKTAVAKGPDAWTVEAAVPAEVFGRYAPQPGRLWGFNLCRERRANEGGHLELFNWANVNRNFHTPNLFGHVRFVSADWKADEAGVRAAAAEAGGARCLVYVEDGFWEIDRSGAARLHTYREIASQLRSAKHQLMEELRAIYERRPDMTLRSDFEKLLATHRQVEGLITTPGPVRPEVCAQAQTHLRTLNDQLERIYWRVRLVLLNESL